MLREGALSVTKDLKFLQENIETILDTMADGLFTVDLSGRITYWNKGAERITGYSKEEALGKNCNIFEGETCKGPTCDTGIMKCGLFSLGSIENRECTFRTKDGRETVILKNARVLKNRQGEIIGGIENITDITSLKKIKEEITDLQSRLKKIYSFENIVGKNHKMLNLYDLIKKAANSNASILIQGESGTGKELIANAIHYLSSRKNYPLIKVSCSALSETILESELFGHVKGAFTGAIKDHAGRFEAAKDGTLFLDEIGDISPLIQIKLLRVLQEKEFERVGDNKPIKADVRIISATNKDLKQLVDQGKFRDDLYYRLKVFPIQVLPLRERKDDIPLLVDHFIKKFNQQNSKQLHGCSPEAMKTILNHSWPGNIRELENALEYAFVVTDVLEIRLEDLPTELIQAKDQHHSPTISPETHLKAVLEENHWNRIKTAQALGISRVSLWKRMKKYRIMKD
jgi:PAS domain S-box-containing protein